MIEFPTSPWSFRCLSRWPQRLYRGFLCHAPVQSFLAIGRCGRNVYRRYSYRRSISGSYSKRIEPLADDTRNKSYLWVRFAVDCGLVFPSLLVNFRNYLRRYGCCWKTDACFEKEPRLMYTSIRVPTHDR